MGLPAADPCQRRGQSRPRPKVSRPTDRFSAGICLRVVSGVSNFQSRLGRLIVVGSSNTSTPARETRQIRDLQDLLLRYGIGMTNQHHSRCFARQLEGGDHPGVLLRSVRHGLRLLIARSPVTDQDEVTFGPIGFAETMHADARPDKEC